MSWTTRLPLLEDIWRNEIIPKLSLCVSAMVAMRRTCSTFAKWIPIHIIDRENAFLLMAKEGHFTFFKRALEAKMLPIDRDDDLRLVRAATQANQLEFLVQLFELLGPLPIEVPRIAALMGHLDLLKHPMLKKDMLSWSADVMDYALAGGHQAIIDWLKACYPYVSNYIDLKRVHYIREKVLEECKSEIVFTFFYCICD